MKRRSILALLLILALLPAAVLGEEEIPVYYAGDTFLLEFTVTENQNAAIVATLALDYDHTALELVPTNYAQNDAPIINMNMFGIPVGEKVMATFRVRPEAAGGIYGIKVIVTAAADIDENVVEGFAFSDCKIKIVDMAEELAAAQAELQAAWEQIARQESELNAAQEQISAQATELEASKKEAAQYKTDLEKAEEEKESLRNELAQLEEQIAYQAADTASPESDFQYRIENEQAILEKYIGNEAEVVIPDRLGGYPVISIADAFYYCSRLKNITIPNSVTTIEEYAFSDCTSLNSITIPSSVTSINDNAFYKCYSLRSVTIPNSVTSINNNVFYRCNNLTDITIPNSIENIGSYAFYGCKSLISIKIPNSVKTIEHHAFILCSNLASITIPNSVSEIGYNAFYGCKNLTVTVTEGSYAEQYCRENGIKYQVK